MTNLDSVLKTRGYSADKVHIVKAVVFPVVTYGEGRMPKNWCLQTVVLEKTSESPLDSKDIKSVNLKGNQPWILIGRTDADTEAPVFWSSDTNSQLSLMLVKIEGRRRRGCQRMKWMYGISDAIDMNLGKL